MIYPQEKNFKSLKQLTFGGDNAEAYWNFSDTKLVFQSNNPDWEVGCDQIFIMDKLSDKSLSEASCKLLAEIESSILTPS